jgi:F-type H+/Na+-transporting ATPase subunit beta
MPETLHLNVHLLRRRVPNLTVAARNAGLRPATVSDLCTGKIELGRAEVRTLVALADLAGCSLDELVIRGPGAQVIETGIKVLDLFAPLVRGGSVGLVARQGLGQTVLLAELLRRLRSRGIATVAWLPVNTDPVLQEIVAEADATCATPAEIERHIAAQGDAREVVVAADRASVLSGELDALRERLPAAGARPVTFALMDARGEAPDEEAPYGPLETLWRFDVSLAARGLFPAIDPVASTATVLEGGHLDPAHLALQQRARKLLRRYRELHALAQFRGADRIPANEQVTFRRGERLEAFLTHPLYVAEPYTAIPGQWVTTQETLEGVRLILDGGADDLDPADLKFRGPFGSTLPSGR